MLSAEYTWPCLSLRVWRTTDRRCHTSSVAILQLLAVTTTYPYIINISPGLATSNLTRRAMHLDVVRRPRERVVDDRGMPIETPPSTAEQKSSCSISNPVSLCRLPVTPPRPRPHSPNIVPCRRTQPACMAVEAKDSYDVMLLPGDGIGPEITAATVEALEPLESLFKINFKEVIGRTRSSSENRVRATVPQKSYRQDSTR